MQFKFISLLKDLDEVIQKMIEEIENFKYKVLNTQATTMDLFDPMYENDLVTADTGYIHQDYDIYVEDITVSDKLKQALLRELVL